MDNTMKKMTTIMKEEKEERGEVPGVNSEE